MTPLLRFARALVFCGVALLSCIPARAQIGFSIDWQSATISDAPAGASPITESDVLGPAPGAPGFGPLGTPTLSLTGDAFGLPLYAGCVGHPPGVPCGVEVDALSRGLDALFTPAGLPQPESGNPPAGKVWYSLEEWGQGSGIPVPGHATVLSEAAVGDASADVFVDTGIPVLPIGPGVGHSAGTIDGDGLFSASGFAYFGTGLKEPNVPTAGVFANPGDNLDALDIGFGTGFPPGGIYFSLDAAYSDPQALVPNSATAATVSFSGADILFVPTGPPGTATLYASAAQLGLDQTGPGLDDVDALIVGENGIPGYQPSLVLFDWLGPAGPTDMLMFSVRRGSAIIGTIDSIFGVKIEEGDILVPPAPGEANPGIFIAAEILGLATVRGGHVLQFGADLDALSSTGEPCFDCNGNGVEDAVDIGTGFSMDDNNNGIPDECEENVAFGCTCPMGSAPCNNPDPSAGCANSTGVGARLTWNGTTSVFSDDMQLLTTDLPPNVFGILFMGTGPANVPFGDGIRCTGGTTWRYLAAFSRDVGVITYGPGIVGLSCATFPAAGCIDEGDTWHFQTWYRDPNGPCGSTFNLSNGLTIDFTQ